MMRTSWTGLAGRNLLPDPQDRERGVGWTVDVPDVFRMLELVRDGRTTVEQAHDKLLALTKSYSE